jgi:hypothetical protein
MSKTPPGPSVARAAVEAALTLDRTSARLVHGAEARMVTAQADFDSGMGGPDMAVALTVTNALQVAIGASMFATNYEHSCRMILATALDELSHPQGEVADPPAATRQAAPSASAAAIVVAEATAIAAAAEARLASDTYAGTIVAADRAQDAVLVAAATDARAAEDELRARAVVDMLAADEVADAAATAARDEQLRAELDPAAVADAVFLDSSTISAAEAANAAASEQDVRAAAQAVLSMAQVIADEISEASLGVRDGAPVTMPFGPVVASLSEPGTP